MTTPARSKDASQALAGALAASGRIELGYCDPAGSVAQPTAEFLALVETGLARGGDLPLADEEQRVRLEDLRTAEEAAGWFLFVAGQQQVDERVVPYLDLLRRWLEARIVVVREHAFRQSDRVKARKVDGGVPELKSILEPEARLLAEALTNEAPPGNTELFDGLRWLLARIGGDPEALLYPIWKVPVQRSRLISDDYGRREWEHFLDESGREVKVRVWWTGTTESGIRNQVAAGGPMAVGARPALDFIEDRGQRAASTIAVHYPEHDEPGLHLLLEPDGRPVIKICDKDGLRLGDWPRSLIIGLEFARSRGDAKRLS